MKCTSCQSDLAERDRVCKVCGYPVSLNPGLEDLYFSRLAANAPSLLVEKVRSARYLEKERRTVTALMFTIANVDTFEQTIPKDQRTPILNEALDRFAQIIFQYEGTIAKLWENTVLAFFGAPVTHEDDPLRAAHASAAILEEVQHYSDELKNSFGVPLTLNLVMNSGPILIGNIKSNLKFDFRSLNNTLECMDYALYADIPQCEIILFEDSYRFIKPFVECTKLDDVLCEGLNETMHLWRVNALTSQSNHIMRMPASHNISLIGRQKELDLLMELSETVLAGLGRVGLIVGEPGIGKSRLVLEWKRSLKTLRQPTQVRWVEAHGLAFGRELAYHLLKDLVRNALNLSTTTSKSQLINDLQAALSKISGIDQDSSFLYLAHLLDIQLSKAQEEQIHHLNALELRAKYLNVVRQLLRNMAIEQPLIIVLEDLHWADASSIEILIELLSITSASSILFCLVSRTDRESSGWKLIMSAREKFGPRLTRVELENLNENESEQLVKQLISLNEIPDIIRKVVIEKSEGNPYFIEELIRMLVNEGVLIKMNDHWTIAPNIDPNKIPDSLQGLLSARIDRLPEDARLTLRVASVIGRNFSENVLEFVMASHAPDVELIEQLSTLESIGMIKVAQVNPELTYTFQHILLHEAAYNSIYEADRSGLHLTVGNVLERVYPNQKERYASQLAFHFQEAHEPEKAYQYLDLAGHVAMNSFANAEAEMYFQRAAQFTEDTQQLAHLSTDLGEALAQQTKHREAIQAWRNAIRHHKKLGHPDRLARIYAWSARSAWWGYDPKRSLEICLEGLEAIKGAVESPDIAYLIHETGRAYLFNNQPDKAKSYSEQALEMAQRLDAYDVQAESLATIGILPTIKPQQAIAALEMAVKISESNNLFGPASRAYINLAAVIDNLGEIRLARDYRKRALELGDKAGGVSDELLIHQSIANASLWLADFGDSKQLIEQMRQNSREKDAYLAENTLNLLFLEGQHARFKGNFSSAIEVLTDLIDRSRQTNDLERVVQANRALAEVIIESHLLDDPNNDQSNIDIAHNMIGDAIYSGKDTLVGQDVATLCLVSEIHALRGNLADAEKMLGSANTAYRAQPIMQDRVRIVLAQARIEKARNKFENALKLLDESVELLDKMEGRWWKARIWLEMGDIYLLRNEPEDIDQAQNFFRDALAEFKEMDVNNYPDIILEKLRRVKHVSRAQAIAHRKLNQELAEAGRVQNTFIPTHAPEIPGYQISGVLLPARETSGDFFDFINLDNGKLGLVIADVGDKGAGAALYMAMSRTLIRTYAGENKLEPEDVIRQVNRRILTDTQQGIFLTVVFGILDPEKGKFTYVNAGHNPPILVKKKDNEIKLIYLKKTGTLVGIFGENTWNVKTIELKPGEVLVLHTDGIPEAQNEAGEFFGDDRLINTLRDGFNDSPEVYRNAILENVQAFTGTAPRLDDITLVILSREK